MDWLHLTERMAKGLVILLSAGWGIGGWLLAGSIFPLRRGERLISGLAAGWLLFITLVNFITPVLGLVAASWAASGLVLAAGLFAALRAHGGRRGRDLLARCWADVRAEWAAVVFLVALTALFSGIEHGLAVFDEDLHLPLVSVMAAGDIPPHFYLNPSQYFAYHYALQVWAATLVRLAGMYPWSALDLSKALAIAFTLVLGWVWIRRVTRSRAASWSGSLLLTFGGGARWLLLLLPADFLKNLSSAVQLNNTGANTAGSLIDALIRPWAIVGGGPLPFPFAYHNGLFVPIISILGSTGALPFLTILLLLLIVPRRELSWAGAAALTLLMANLALSAEHLFAFLWIGLAVVLLTTAWQDRRQSLPGQQQQARRLLRSVWLRWAAVLAVSAALSLVQGGFITESARSVLERWMGVAAGPAVNQYTFGLRWPPGFYTAHLGVLSVFNWRQLVVLLAEIGPALALGPLAVWMGWRGFRRGQLLQSGLAIASVLLLAFPLFTQYGVDRSITRFPGSGLWLWLLLSLPGLYLLVTRKAVLVRGLAWAGYGVTIFGALVIFAIQLVAVQAPQYSYYIDLLDSQFAHAYWNRLEPGAQVLDNIPMRAVTVFGRANTSRSSIYDALPEYEELVRWPDPQQLLKAGYRYVYMNQDWWKILTPQAQALLEVDCVRMAAPVIQQPGAFRWLMDVSGCQDQSSP